MDKVDIRTIAMMLMVDVNLNSYSDTSYHNEEIKPLTRYNYGEAIKIRDAARVSIGFDMPAKSQTKRGSNLFSDPAIPRIGYRMDVMNLDEIENFSHLIR